MRESTKVRIVRSYQPSTFLGGINSICLVWLCPTEHLQTHPSTILWIKEVDLVNAEDTRQKSIMVY